MPSVTFTNPHLQRKGNIYRTPTLYEVITFLTSHHNHPSCHPSLPSWRTIHVPTATVHSNTPIVYTATLKPSSRCGNSYRRMEYLRVHRCNSLHNQITTTSTPSPTPQSPNKGPATPVPSTCWLAHGTPQLLATDITTPRRF